MTDRLYYTDAYVRAFEAHVVETTNGGCRVYLDRTAFYPTSGGQPHDTGVLGAAAVIDVVDEGDRIAHVLAGPLAAEPGAVVEGQIDWPRRFDHMQQHTGQHLLSAIFADRFGLETVSVHFGPESSTLDLATESIGRDRILEAETLANELLWQNRAIAISFEDAAAAEGLRKPPAREGTLRVVTIQDVDRSACGGTHVRATGEIGPVLLRRTEKVRRETRVEFLCGGRALRRARGDFEALADVARHLSAAPADVPALVAAQAGQLRTLQSETRRMGEELAAFRAREVYERQPADSTGVRRVVERRASDGADELRALARAFTALPRAVFIGAVAAPPLLVVAASEDAGLDAGAELRRALDAVGGRGGGSPRMAQGTVPGREMLNQVVAEIAGEA